MFSFKYSERPNTLASKRLPDDVPEGEKTRRIVALQSLQKKIQAEIFSAAVGRTFDVLVDSRSARRDWELSGRTSGNTVVNFAGEKDWIGRDRPVRITGANPNSLRGDAVTLDTSAQRLTVDRVLQGSTGFYRVRHSATTKTELAPKLETDHAD